MIIKNVDIIGHTWGGIDISASSQYSIEEVDRLRLLSDSVFLDDLSNELAIVNDDIDLNPTLGLLALQKQLKTVHQAISFAPAIGTKAPGLVKLTPTSVAFGNSFDVGDELYALTHIDGYVVDSPQLQIHLAIDNSVSDRWVQFQFDILSTTGILDKALDGIDETIVTAQVEVPTTPFLIFETKINLPESLFEDDRDNLFIKLSRIVATGKTAPENNPIVVRIDKIHKQRLDL